MDNVTYYKSLTGTLTFIVLHGLGLTLILSTTGFLKIIGYFDYFITTFLLWFIVAKYMEGEFYKNLGVIK
jgi:hypothetical protein